MSQFDHYRVTDQKTILRLRALDAFFANVLNRLRFIITVAGDKLTGIPTCGVSRYDLGHNAPFFHLAGDDGLTYRIPVEALEDFEPVP